MEDPTLNELIRNTEVFFENHWNVDLLGKPPELNRTGFVGDFLFKLGHLT